MVRHVKAADPAVPHWDLAPVTPPPPHQIRQALFRPSLVVVGSISFSTTMLVRILQIHHGGSDSELIAAVTVILDINSYCPTFVIPRTAQKEMYPRWTNTEAIVNL
ncbi:hypothetical protein EDD18DRAFT_867931 [Armillaria luteobubalina]|uniref:Uncharacterized protein n=1 Tax=Armillaria luteobubalina TaxID=153913 RepID=A0AA39P8X2_9AGAR|nr:hypothetical protein EDD18DRAFT_867931 [Armillaria luteobubalina]